MQRTPEIARSSKSGTGRPTARPLLILDSKAEPGGHVWFAGSPVWSPDGREIAFRYSPTKAEKLRLVASADGTGEAREIDELLV